MSELEILSESPIKYINFQYTKEYKSYTKKELKDFDFVKIKERGDNYIILDVQSHDKKDNLKKINKLLKKASL